MVTIAIIGILAAVAIPTYVGYGRKARRNAAWTDLESLRLLQEQYYAENNTYTNQMTDLSGFNPGTNAEYSYSITLGNTTDFRVEATSPDDATTWFIEEDNNRNF